MVKRNINVRAVKPGRVNGANRTIIVTIILVCITVRVEIKQLTSVVIVSTDILVRHVT